MPEETVTELSVRQTIKKSDATEKYSVIATDMSSASDGTGILFNLDGEVIGMISSDIWKDRGIRANAYAISDLKLVMQLLANGASVPYIGV